MQESSKIKINKAPLLKSIESKIKFKEMAV